MTRTARWMAAVAVATLAVALLLPAAADWLVLRDGSRMETAGPWRVESRLVVFKRPDGTLASVRLSDVDLEASESVTREAAEGAAEAAEAAPDEAPPPREPVLRLTEKDLPPMRRPPADDDRAESPREGAADEPRKPLEIVNWREVGGIGSPGIEIVGTVRNNSAGLAIGVGVTGVLYDQNDEEVARVAAILTSTALQPSQSSAFRASFPGVYQYGRAELTASGNVVRTETPAEEEPSDDGL